MIFHKIIKLIELELIHWEGILNDKFILGLIELEGYRERSKIIKKIWNEFRLRIYMNEKVTVYAYSEARMLSMQCESIIYK